MEQRLSLVTLGVADLQRSIAFYEGLGWTRSLRSAEGVAFFRLGGIGLSLYPLSDLAADAGVPIAPPSQARSITLAHNVRDRAEVDRVVDAMRLLGGTVVKAPEEKAWGGYASYAADPDGHLWEVAWNPGFPLDPSGNLVIPD